MTLNELYPEIKPNQEFHIPVSDLHSVYVASYGNPEGIPVAVLHGGPGSGTHPSSARFFDPAKYHIILSDQRGAGLSTPKGEMKENTTQDLIADLEVIRKRFGIEKWAVFGGSWGSFLALVYAETHPERVLTLFLRGIFLGREDDISALARDNTPATMIHNKEWQEFKVLTQAFIDRAGLSDRLTLKGDSIYHIYYVLLQQPDASLRKEAAQAIASWEGLNSYLIPEVIDPSPDDENMGLTEATYFEHDCFVPSNYPLDNIARLKGILIYIVQGLYDLVCPRYMADELEDALRRVNPEPGLVKRTTTIAGHSQREPETRSALIAATSEFAEQLKPTRVPVRTPSPLFFGESTGATSDAGDAPETVARISGA